MIHKEHFCVSFWTIAISAKVIRPILEALIRKRIYNTTCDGNYSYENSTLLYGNRSAAFVKCFFWLSNIDLPTICNYLSNSINNMFNDDWNSKQHKTYNCKRPGWCVLQRSFINFVFGHLFFFNCGKTQNIWYKQRFTRLLCS